MEHHPYSRLARLLAGAVVAASMLLLAYTSQAASLRVMGFAGASNWPLFVAQEQGHFAARGLDVEVIAAPSSSTQMHALIGGDIDIAMTAMDNVVAYDDRGTKAAGADLVAVLAANQGGRSKLVAARGVRSIADLRGRALAVDAIDTGYAFVLHALLERGGLAPGEYELVSAGGSRQRWKALEEGKVAAALLNAPFDATAESAGFRVLATSYDVASRYQGSVAAVRRDWARAHGDTLIAFIRAYVDAVEWLRDPAHREAALRILARRVPGVADIELARSYADLQDPESGALSPRAAIDIEGVRTVLALRARYGKRGTTVADPYRYYDSFFYERALAQ